MYYLTRVYISEMTPDWVVVSTNVILFENGEMPPPRHTIHGIHGKFQIIEKSFSEKKEALECAKYHHETYAKEPANDDYYMSGQLTLF